MDISPTNTSKSVDSAQGANFNSSLQLSGTEQPLNVSPGAVQLRKWLNKTLKIEMSDGRVLIGIFLCTDRDANVILGSCSEYLPEDITSEDTCSFSTNTEEPRMLGLVMVPGKHIVSICIDQNEENTDRHLELPHTSEINSEEVM